MTTITGSDTYFTNIDSAFTATKWEACIDQAIDKLNLYGLSISNLSGTAGSKTGSYTSAEAGAIRELSLLIYASIQSAGSSSNSYSLGVISESSSTSSTSGSSSNINGAAQQMAAQLKPRKFTRT